MIGQIVVEENFESGNIPVGWEIESLATDGGWNFGSNQSLSSQFFQIQNNGSSGIAATNDDQCNCNKSNDRLITPLLDLTGMSDLILKFDLFYGDNFYVGFQEDAIIEVSSDKINWTTVERLGSTSGWTSTIVDISEFADDNIYISFRYADNGGWMFGCAVDNVSVEVPATLDAELTETTTLPFGEIGNVINLGGTVYNNSITAINSLDILYNIDGANEVSETLSNLDIAPYTSYDFELSNPWTATDAGVFLIELAINQVNGMDDEDSSNNDLSFNIEIFEKIQRPNLIRDIMNSTPEVTVVATFSDLLDRPTDLDFFPILGKDELWVVNQRTETNGGSTVTISNASTTPSDMWQRVDGNAWHFMSLPSGIAFSEDNYNFATSPGVRDANHNGGTFTGPTLWSSDPLIYAQPSGGNGSHLDMLHSSPFSMGIAHEKDNVFWVYDNFNKDIVRYDFVEDHGPGNDDHSDAQISRYRNIGIDADGNIPSHMILGKETSWLYFVDNGNDRVMRLDINSGNVANTLMPFNEPLAVYNQIAGYTVETIIDTGLVRACGIEIIDDLLLVGDYETGEVIVYDMNDEFAEMGRIEASTEGLTGIKVGPDGSLWATNRISNRLVKVQVGESTSVEDDIFSDQISVYPNPATEFLNIELSSELVGKNVVIKLKDLTGKVIFNQTLGSRILKILTNTLANGVYILAFNSENTKTAKRIVIQK